MTLLANAPGRPLRTIHRLNEEERQLYEIISKNVFFVSHPSFDEPGIEEKLFGSDAEIIRIANWVAPATIQDENATRRKKTKSLTKEQQETLFLRYNYARYRLSALLEKQKRRFSLSRAREMIVWHRRALSACSDIVNANLPLVAAMAKKCRGADVEFGELISEGNLALFRAVNKFDVSRGFRFSTYACRSIILSFKRMIGLQIKHNLRFPCTFEPEWEKPDESQKREVLLADENDFVRFILNRNLAGLTKLERLIIAERFPLFGKNKGETLCKIGEKVGLSNERVRQIICASLKELRRAIERHN